MGPKKSPTKPTTGRPSWYNPEFVSSPVHSPVKIGARPTLYAQHAATPNTQRQQPGGTATSTPSHPLRNNFNARPAPARPTPPVQQSIGPPSLGLRRLQEAAAKAKAELLAEQAVASQRITSVLDPNLLHSKPQPRTAKPTPQIVKPTPQTVKPAPQSVKPTLQTLKPALPITTTRPPPAVKPPSPPRPPSPTTSWPHPTVDPVPVPPTAVSTPGGSSNQGPRTKPPIKPILKNRPTSNQTTVGPPPDPAAAVIGLVNAIASSPAVQGTPSRVPVATTYLEKDPLKPSRKHPPGEKPGASPSGGVATSTSTSSFLGKPPITHGGRTISTNTQKRKFPRL